MDYMPKCSDRLAQRRRSAAAKADREFRGTPGVATSCGEVRQVHPAAQGHRITEIARVVELSRQTTYRLLDQGKERSLDE
jgi:hypothetical protein